MKRANEASNSPAVKRLRRRRDLQEERPEPNLNPGLYNNNQNLAAPGHPLLLRVVLQRLFHYVDDDKDLRAYRLVHTEWNAEATFQLKKRRSCFVQIKTSPKAMDFETCAYLRRFTRCLQNSLDFPFYRISISLHTDVDQRGWINLLRAVAPWVKELRLILQDTEFPLIPENIEFPNLLGLEVQNQYDLLHVPDIPRIFKTSPKLKWLKLPRIMQYTIRLLCLTPVSSVLESLTIQGIVVLPQEGDWLPRFLKRQPGLKVLELCPKIMEKYGLGISSLSPAKITAI